MTVNQFIKELAELDFKWYNPLITMIRTKNDYQCPLTALSNHKYKTKYKNHQWDSAAAVLGIPERTAHLIIDAADNINLEKPMIKAIREKLIKALKLNY